MKIANKIDLWVKIGRGYTLPQSILPYMFAVLIASKHCQVNWFLSILGLVGVVLVHASINMLDDYFDWTKGEVEEYKKLLDAGMQARTHKCFYLEQNLITSRQLLFAALSYDVIASLIGIYIATKVGLSVILIAAIAGILGFFYSAPPLKLNYRGLGELSIGVIFGPLLMAGAYITAGASIDKPIIYASIILGILIANIAYAHAIMDYESDLKVKKNSLPIICGSKINAIKLLAFLYFLAYFVFAIAVYTRVYPSIAILVFITAPMTVGLVKLMQNQDTDKKLWMGFIENWSQYKEEGSDYFMMRLCITRNIVTHFIVMLGIIYYLFGG